MKTVFLSISTVVLLLGAPQASADEVRLMNGRTMSGIISEENDETVTLDVGIGQVKLKRFEIMTIERSAPEEAEGIRSEWATKRLHDEVRQPSSLYRTRSPWGRK